MADLAFVFVVGDSISMDYGPSLASALAPYARYARKEGDDVARLNLDIPSGANGGDSGRLRAFLEGLALSPSWGAQAPTWLVINAGLHDIKRPPQGQACQVDEDSYRRNLEAITTLAHDQGWSLVWVRTTPVIDDVHNRISKGFQRYAADQARYNQIADSVMSAAQVPIIDLEAFTAQQGGAEIFRDHVHFIPQVSQAQGEWLAEQIRGLHP